MNNQDKQQKKNGMKGKDKDREENNLPLILIAEDNPEERKLLGNILRKESYRISIAENGRQTIEMVFNAPPDLILLDVLMPEMDGFEVCKKLKESPETHDIPIIFITGLIDEIKKIKGLQDGAVDYVTKPVNLSELLARIRNHVDLKRSKDKINEELKAARQALENELSEKP